MNFSARASVVLCGFLACSTPLSAQTAPPTEADDQLTDLALEDLLKMKVYAASRFVQDAAQAPASVSVITADEIRNHGYRTLADILRSVRGFYVTYDRDYSYVGVRGFSRPGDYNGRVLMMVNGHRLNDTIFEQALVGTESPLDVALIERVEVVRGPSSSLYGTSAFFAVVNIITRSGRSIDGVEVAGEGGSQALGTGRITAGGRSASGVQGLLSVSAYRTRGNQRLYFPEFNTPADGDGIARDVDDDRSASVFGSATAHGLDLQGGFGSRRKQIPTGAFGTVFGDPRTETIDARGFLDLHYTRLLQSRSTLDARASYDRYEYTGAFAYDTGLFEDAAHGAWVSTELALIRQFDRHGLTAGGEYQNNLKQDQTAENETGVLLDDRRRTKTAALYVEDELRVAPGVILNAGLRWDHYFDTFGGTVNPRLGLIVTPFDGAALKALYGRAFRAPNPYELYYDQNALSATLKPERIETYELAWEQSVSNGLHVNLAAFHNRVRDLIVQESGSDTIDGLYYVNRDTANVTGAELEVQADLPHHVRGRASHTFQFMNDARTGDRMSNSPRHLANLILDAPLARSGWLLAFNAYRIGDRVSVSGGLVEGAFVADLTVSRPTPSRGLGLAVSLRNLFNAAYGDPASVEHRQQAIPQDGRTLGVRATWRFR